MCVCVSVLIFVLQRRCSCNPAPELCRLMLRRLGKSLCRESSGSWIDERELFARIRETRPGYMRPSLRTSAQSCSWLSVICSRHRDGHSADDTLTLSYSFRHKNNSSSLHAYNHKKKKTSFSAWQNYPFSQLVGCHSSAKTISQYIIY